MCCVDKSGRMIGMVDSTQVWGLITGALRRCLDGRWGNALALHRHGQPWWLRTAKAGRRSLGGGLEGPHAPVFLFPVSPCSFFSVPPLPHWSLGKDTSRLTPHLHLCPPCPHPNVASFPDALRGAVKGLVQWAALRGEGGLSLCVQVAPSGERAAPKADLAALRPEEDPPTPWSNRPRRGLLHA